MSDGHDPERLAALEARLDAAKGAQGPKSSRGEEHFSQANMAWRMVIELVVGLGLGLAIGYGLDQLLGTTPFLMIVFMGFGFVAGIKTMMRTAGEIQSTELAKDGGEATGSDAETDESAAQVATDAGTPASDERT